MHTRSKSVLALLAIAAVSAAGMGMVAHRRKPAALGSRALDAIPSGALVVGVADLVALRSSPVGAPFLREGREIPGLGKVRDICGFDPMDGLTEVAVAIPAAGDEGEFGLVAAGPVEDAALLACASKVIEARGGRPVMSTLGGFRSIRDARVTVMGGEIAVKKGGPLLLGAGTYLRTMVDAAEGRTPSIRSSRAHHFLGQEVREASLRVTAVLSPQQRRSLAEELEGGGAADSPARSIMAGALGLSLGASTALHAVVSCDDAAECVRLAGTLSAARDARAREARLDIASLGTILKKVSIVAQGEMLHARVEIPSDDAATLVEQLLTLRGGRRLPASSPHAEPSNAAPDDVLVPRPAGSVTAPASSAPKHPHPQH